MSEMRKQSGRYADGGKYDNGYKDKGLWMV